MHNPKLPLTVPRSIWNDMATAVRPSFADSYLSGAEVIGTRLLPHTVVAWAAINREPDALKAIRAAGLTLVKPLPFDDLRRDAHRQAIVDAHHGGALEGRAA